MAPSAAKPRHPPTAQLARTSDTGRSQSDGITSDRSPTIVGRAQPGSTVVLTQGRIAVAESKVKENGGFEIRLVNLRDGHYRYEVAQLIKPGVGVFAPKAINFTVDTRRPMAPTVDDPEIVLGKWAPISGESKEPGELRFYLDGRPQNRFYTRSGRWEAALDFETGIRHGHVKLVDDAGNESSIRNFTLIGSTRVTSIEPGFSFREYFSLKGTNIDQIFGYTVSSAGDFDGDGVDDLLTGAPVYDNVKEAEAGAAFIVYGKKGETRYTDLELPYWIDGFSTSLVPANDARTFGATVAPAGDVNGDGLADVLVGAPAVAGGAVWVVFGSRERAPAIDVANMRGTGGFLLTGDSENPIGGTLAGGGDVNGDGYDDIIVGPGDRGRLSGRQHVYVIFGKPTGFAASIHLPSRIKDVGISISGVGSRFGLSTALNSDLNDDGFDDIVITSPLLQEGGGAANGAVTVFYGRRNLSDLHASTRIGWQEGFQVRRPKMRGDSGPSLAVVSTGGDVNGDKIDDAVLSAGFAGTNLREVVGYVIFGQSEKRRQPLEIDKLKPSDGYRVMLERTGDVPYLYPSTISIDTIEIARDVNGDKIDDLLVSTPGFRARDANTMGPGRPAAFLVFGRKKDVSPFLHLQALRPEEGRQVRGRSDLDVGYSIEGLGDFDNDGLGDFAFGAPSPGRVGTRGGVYGLFGTSKW